jgi:hypothetical protein
MGRRHKTYLMDWRPYHVLVLLSNRVVVVRGWLSCAARGRTIFRQGILKVIVPVSSQFRLPKDIDNWLKEHADVS